MTHDNLAGLYAGGAARLAPSALADAGLDPQACTWLSDPGMPVRPQPAIPLIEFVKPAMRKFGDGAGLVIAREPWADELWLVVLPDGRVMTAGQGEAHVFVNTRIENFLHFLAAFQHFQTLASRADGAPRVYTQAEMQARLAALQRGDIRPRQGAEDVAFDRAEALRQLERAWRGRDAAALERGSWWSRIDEQLRDGLL
ncbi:MAG: SUKH-4 family immunity protein [Bordetella sp.]|nr:SUKH-4 family immunity protein [Bordetella sp.]